MAATDRHDRAADLLERLLTDRAFRASFRQNPAAAAKKYGLDDLAEELSGKGKALYTLEIRESRSSLAGMMLAAAAEGVSASDLADQVGQGQLDTPAQIALTRALSRVDLQAVAGPSHSGADGVAGAGVEAVDPAAAGPALNDSGQGLESGVFAGVGEPGAEPEGASDTMQFSAVDAPAPVGDAPEAPADAPPAAGADLASAAGGAGGGQATIEAVIDDPDLDLPPEVEADLRSGEIDPRAVMLLHKLGNSGHEVGLSVMKTGHRQFTSGGSVSNHFVGRGFDIATVDGKAVDPTNEAARDVAEQLAGLPPELRPTEIGTPWDIGEDGFFTDAAHCNHLHIGWDGPCPDSVRAEFDAGSGVAATGQGGPPGAAGGPAVPDVADVVEQAERNVGQQSGVFAGIVDEDATKVQNGDGAARSGAGTMQFSAVQEVDQPAASGAAVPDPADLATGPNAYPGDDAPKEAIAAWMAREAQKRGLPGELPVMAALVESNLTNVNYGDADSLGYFQMRTSIWDSGEYAGFSQDPEKQLDWFLDHAVGVKEKRISQGYTDFVDDPNKWGDWVADVERPAEQYRGRYQLRLDEARGLLANAPQAPPVEDAAAAGQPAAGAADDLGAAAAGAGGGQATIDAVLADPDLDLPPEAVADLKSGEMDPRLVMMLHKMGNSGHEVGLSVIKSGHRQFTSGGSVSNHFVGRGFDVATVDGKAVDPSNLAARDLAEQLADLPSELRPTEIGTPWQIDEEGFFTDGAHCNHLHIGWDGPCPDSVRAEFEAGTGVAAPSAGAGVAAGPAAGAAGAEVAPVVEEAERNVGRQSGVFAGIVDEEARKEAEAAAKAPHSTVQFMEAIQPEAPAADSAEVASTPSSTEPPAGDAQVLPAVVDALPGEYPGDGAPKEDIARWMAAHAQAAGLPAELPVMAALVESNLTNVNYGDADSLGYFQMRTSIWNQGQYAGFAENPELQLKWFIDTAVAVKEKRASQGYTDFVDDPSKWGQWIADVERPAEQYRGRYQLKLADAQGLLGATPPA